jgi:hypothetical protein
MAHHQQDPLVISMDDDLIHTEEHPFCSTDPSCPCYEDPERINAVAEALSCPALLATSTAFGALCWETSAMGYHRLADQAQQRDRSQEAARWLSQAVQDLNEAVRDWWTVLLWLERLASSGSGTWSGRCGTNSGRAAMGR